MSREFGRPTGSPRAGDQLSEAPDSTRPSNPWPRVLAFFGVVVLSLALMGYCVLSFASPPARELTVEVNAMEVGTPRFLPVMPFGSDAEGFTYGAYLTVLPAGDPVAVLSRAPESGCQLAWEPLERFEGVNGVFVDRCSDARYASDGRALHADAPRDLHRFEVSRQVRDYVVSISRITLGECRVDGAVGCSPPGAPVERTMPPGALPADFAGQ